MSTGLDNRASGIVSYESYESYEYSGQKQGHMIIIILSMTESYLFSCGAGQVYHHFTRELTRMVDGYFVTKRDNCSSTSPMMLLSVKGCPPAEACDFYK